MPITSRTNYGNTFGEFSGTSNNIASINFNLGDIDYTVLNRRGFADGTELSEFYDIIRTFILARLGYPVVRVELADIQILTAIDEAITKLDFHAPDWCTHFMTFQTSAHINMYELPQVVLNNFQYAAYKKTLLSVARQEGQLEFDFFIKYFQENFLFNDFAVSDFLLMKMHLKQIRKILGRDGTFDVVGNKYLAIYPIPMGLGDQEEVVVQFKALNSDKLHPYFINWIQKYSLAVSKGILGEIRGKYRELPSPGGGAVLNGPQLIEESEKEKEQLIDELYNEIEEPPVWTVF